MLVEENKVQEGAYIDMNCNSLVRYESVDTANLIPCKGKKIKKQSTQRVFWEVQRKSAPNEFIRWLPNGDSSIKNAEDSFKKSAFLCGTETDNKKVPRSEEKNARAANRFSDLQNLTDLVWRKKLSRTRHLGGKISPSRKKLAVQRSVCLLLTLLGGALVALPPASGFVPDFIAWGYCSDVHLQQDFDPVKYQGWWWDIYRVPNSYEGVDKCIHQNITLKDDVLVVDMEGLSNTGQLSSKTAYVSSDTAASQRDLARRTVDAEGVPSAPYLVVATDYLEYACVYSCLQFPGVFAEFFWIFGRQPSLEEKYSEECVRQFRLAGIQPEKLVKVAQGEECPYSPHLAAMRHTNQQILQGVQRDEKTEKLLSFSSVSNADSAFLREDKNAAGKISLWLGGWSILVTVALLSWTQIRCGSLCS